MSDAERVPGDWRYEELRRLGEAERRMALELADTRDAVARLVNQLLPQHARPHLIEEVARVAGYSRWTVERMRDGQLWWR